MKGFDIEIKIIGKKDRQKVREIKRGKNRKARKGLGERQIN